MAAIRGGNFAPRAGELQVAQSITGIVRVGNLRRIGHRLQEPGRIGCEVGRCARKLDSAHGRQGVVADELRAFAVLPACGYLVFATGLQFDRIVFLSLAVGQQIKRQPEGFFVERAWNAVFDDGVAAVGLHDEPLLAAGETDGRAGAAAVCLGSAKHGA